MVDRLQNALHHWWPRSLSKFWADATGHVHRLSSNGDLDRSFPQQFGAIRNNNNIRSGDAPSLWDHSFENTYSKADNAFPDVVRWLQSLKSPISAVNIKKRERISPIIIEEKQRDILAECIASLVSRSPSFRNRIAITAEYYRARFGLPDPTPPKSLIGVNARHTQKIFSDTIRASGKFAVLLSGEGEFVFGDGFLHNFSSANRPLNPRCLVPITPQIAIFYASPSSYRSFPKAFAMNLSPKEVATINHITQIYSKRFIFFREIPPVVDKDFTDNEHFELEYNKHPWLEDLQTAMADTFFGNDELFHPTDHQP